MIECAPLPPLSDAELEAEFCRFVDNPGVVAVSDWKLDNTSEKFDDEKYWKRAMHNSKGFGEKLSDLLSEPENV